MDYIAGVDEVGRGALAGPLVTGAVILNKRYLYNPSKKEDVFIENSDSLSDTNNDISPEILDLYSQINDSKMLTPKKREVLSEFIKKYAISYSIQTIDSTRVDTIGISKATQEAFFNSIQDLKVKAQHVITDTFEIKKITKENQSNIVSGDKKSITVAAATIISKF